MFRCIRVFFVFVVALVPTVASANLVLQPASASTDMPQLTASSIYNISNVISQGGLSSTYVNRFTDFAAYIASDPTHTFGTDGFQSADGIESGIVDFVLGGNFELTAFALWNRGGGSGLSIDSFELLADDNPSFSSPTNLGSFNAASNVGSGLDIGVEVFSFAPITASHVRLQINSNHRPSGIERVAFHEVAFSTTTAVPETSAFICFSCLAVAAGVRRRR